MKIFWIRHRKKNNTFSDLPCSMSGISDPSDYDDSGIV